MATQVTVTVTVTLAWEKKATNILNEQTTLDLQHIDLVPPARVGEQDLEAALFGRSACLELLLLASEAKETCRSPLLMSSLPCHLLSVHLPWTSLHVPDNVHVNIGCLRLCFLMFFFAWNLKAPFWCNQNLCGLLIRGLKSFGIFLALFASS